MISTLILYFVVAALFSPVIGNVLVTCGSQIKLRSSEHGYVLHSHGVSYSARGSGQQSVTGYPISDQFNNYWAVIGLKDKLCNPGSPLYHGDTIRLQHASSRCWLHSHLFKSPISRNQEISCFGNDNKSDTGDAWKLVLDTGKGTQWMADKKFKLQHVDTQVYLSTHKQFYGDPIRGQAEVYGANSANNKAAWYAAEGVYYPLTVGGNCEGKECKAGEGGKVEL